MAGDLHALLAEHCPALDLTGTQTANVQAGLSTPKTTATIVYRPNTAEITRRRAAGLGGVTNLGWLDLLMDLPAGLPVPLGRTDLRTLRRLPKGCLEITAHDVVRQLTKPLDVEVAITIRPRFRQGLAHAGRFAPYCTRVLALTGTPRNLTNAAIEADFWRIGLIINAATDPEVIVAPEPFVTQRHTPAAWAFAEDIYHQIAAVAGLPAAMTPESSGCPA